MNICMLCFALKEKAFFGTFHVFGPCCLRTMLIAFQSAVLGDKLGFSSNFRWCAQLHAMESANIVRFIQQPPERICCTVGAESERSV